MYQHSGVGGTDWNPCSRYAHTIGKHALTFMSITLDNWDQKLYDYVLSFEDEVNTLMLSMTSKLNNKIDAINMANQILIRQSCFFNQPISTHVCHNCRLYQYV